ncbi:hypothetical protein [Phyllobacterium leguminum]|uniref:Uncharacterized protein n=1 Tax=Phyllobacterium leguminum TaxID=314237 RepID=A0A318SXR9_9HYPH|nr:hypothetical protein [Phyllobacterium leguminum]PYE85189.1 hypothetical protein C7477_13820 [Phyllobacterium leguminum]
MAWWRKLAVKFRNSMENNKWAVALLVGFAPLSVTPDDFRVVQGRPKTLFARLGPIRPVVAAGGLYGFASSMAISTIMFVVLPEIPYLNDAEYATFMGRNTLLCSVLSSIYGSALALFGGFQSWTFHRFCVWLLPKIGLPVNPQPLAYFLLMGASFVVWFGVLTLASEYLSPMFLNGQISDLYDHMGQYPVHTGAIIVILGLLLQRYRGIRNISENQIYPSFWAQAVVWGLWFLYVFFMYIGIYLFFGVLGWLLA